MLTFPSRTGLPYGRKALVGQFTRIDPKTGNRIDLSERINFERSRYIPGNGPDHRLGRKGAR